MSDKRVSEMTDDQIRGLADAAGTWKPDAYYEARRAIVRDARAQGKELITRKAWPGACSDIMYAEPLEGIRIALTRASAARRTVDDYVKIAREEGRTWAQVGQALGLAGTTADRGVPLAEAAFEYVVPVREDSLRFDTPSFGWHCRSCGGFVSDRGPYESHPEDNEHGHAEGCARMAEGRFAVLAGPRIGASQRRCRGGGQRGAPAARSARTNDVEARKVRRSLSWPGEPGGWAVTAAGRGGISHGGSGSVSPAEHCMTGSGICLRQPMWWTASLPPTAIVTWSASWRVTPRTSRSRTSTAMC